MFIAFIVTLLLILIAVECGTRRHDVLPGQAAAVAEMHEDHVPEAGTANAIVDQAPTSNAGDQPPPMPNRQQLEVILAAWQPDNDLHQASRQRTYFPWGA